MHRLHRKCRQTHRDILRSAFLGCRILHPFSLMRDDRLSSPNIDLPALMCHAYHSGQHDCELVELRTLSRLAPSLRTAHVRHADARSLRIDAPDVFVDQLGLGPGSLNPCGLWNESRHISVSHAFEPTRKAWHEAGRERG